MFDLKLLGPPVLHAKRESARLHMKHLGVLAFLSMEQAKPHERVAFSDLFWPDSPSARADNSLRQALNLTFRKSIFEFTYLFYLYLKQLTYSPL